MRAGRAATAAMLALAAACSPAREDGAPPPTADEKRAVADARAMIPAAELPAATPDPTESVKP